jgi:glycosyltransferase involved in cell wall biosynthesis
VSNPIAEFFFTAPVKSTSRDYFLCAGSPGTNGNRGFHWAMQAANDLNEPLKIVTQAKWADMPGIYDRCKALVLPTSWAQGLDLCVAESMARNRPVIVSDVGSYSREAEDNPYIITFPCGDVQRLGKIMKTFSETIVNMGSLIAAKAYAERHRPAFHVQKWLEALGV